jgi:hypothetical protein
MDNNKKKSGSSPISWDGKSGPNGNKFMNKLRTRLQEMGNECHLIDADSIPEKPDEPQKRPKDFGRLVIIHPDTNEPMKAGVNYISNPEHEDVVAAYGDSDPVYDYVLSEDATNRLDNYRKDQKSIRDQWERWETKVSEFFKLLGETVPEHVQPLYKEFLTVRYPKGAMDALQEFVNPPMEQGGYLQLYAHIIDNIVKSDLMAWASRFQEDIDALSEIGEEISDKFKKYLLVNAIRKGPRAEMFRTTLETLQVSKAPRDYAYWLKTLAAAETREENYGSANKKNRAMYVNNNVNDNSVKICVACGESHPEALRDCPNTWWCKACKWRHQGDCDNGAEKAQWEKDKANKKPAANQGKQNSGKKGGSNDKGGPDKKDKKDKKEKYATTGQLNNVSAQIASLKSTIAKEIVAELNGSSKRKSKSKKSATFDDDSSSSDSG